MKNRLSLLGKIAKLGFAVLLIPACSTETWTKTGRNSRTTITAPTALIDLAGKARERKKGVPPESVWNRLGIWQRVADDPPTYVPEGYSSELPRSESEGTWFVDERDGKRIFVPDAPVGEDAPGVLRGEAAKVTDWAY